MKKSCRAAPRRAVQYRTTSHAVAAAALLPRSLPFLSFHADGIIPTGRAFTLGCAGMRLRDTSRSTRFGPAVATRQATLAPCCAASRLAMLRRDFSAARQVLLLWDRILGFDTLEILPVMAASIFHFRAKVPPIGGHRAALGPVPMGPRARRQRRVRKVLLCLLVPSHGPEPFHCNRLHRRSWRRRRSRKWRTFLRTLPSSKSSRCCSIPSSPQCKSDDIPPVVSSL